MVHSELVDQVAMLESSANAVVGCVHCNTPELYYLLYL